MRLKFVIEAEVMHLSGKFATADEIAEAILGDLERANPGTISDVGPDESSEYDTVEWEVDRG